MDTTIRLDRETEAIRYLSCIVRAGELQPGSLLVVVTDLDHRVETALAVDGVPRDPPQYSRVQAMAPLLRLVAEHGHAGVLLAVAREGDPRTQGGDLAWHDAFAGTAIRAGLACHGTYVVTPAGIRRVRPHLTVAA
jgi:hypothetical protein